MNFFSLVLPFCRLLLAVVKILEILFELSLDNQKKSTKKLLKNMEILEKLGFFGYPLMDNMKNPTFYFCFADLVILLSYVYYKAVLIIILKFLEIFHEYKKKLEPNY